MKNRNKKVTVFGLGYIGLPTASLLATIGYRVTGVDIKQEIVDTINRGDIHIVEPELDVMVRSAVNSGNLVASTEPAKGDIYIISVPTPLTQNQEPDLRYIDEVIKNLAPILEENNLVILESTSPVGTTQKIADDIFDLRPDLSIADEGLKIAYCPERVLPGRMLVELVDNDRVVGGINKASTAMAKEFYESFVKGKILATDAKTAEMTKLRENAFRDTNIAFANELSIICDKLGLDVWELIKLANHHPRVNILTPGPGVGGHCIAVDPWFIVSSAPDESRLIRSAREVNDFKPRHVVDMAITAMQEAGDSARICCLGLSYKANVDDMRESPSIEITELLAKFFPGRIVVVEPYAEKLPDKLQSAGAELVPDLSAAIKKCDVILLLTDHDEFASINIEMLAGKKLIDTRGMLRRNAR